VETRNTCSVLVGKPEGLMKLEKYSSRWEDNIKMDSKKQEYRKWTKFFWLRFSGYREYAEFID
jgi:hypothetical protein